MYLRLFKPLLIVFAISAIVACDPEEPNDEEKTGLPGNVVTAIYVADDGIKYFATDNGMATYDGTDWVALNENPKITTGKINHMAFEQTNYGPELWLATNAGIAVASLPIDAVSGATTYNTTNVPDLFPGQENLKGDSVFVVQVDDNHLRWFGTNGGLSVMSGNQWPALNLAVHYAADFFETNRVTSVDYKNDTVYIGTFGGGIARFVGNAPDAITGASPFETPWSNIPSANITAVFIDGNTQWYGSDAGLGRHTGIKAKENWEIYVEDNGLVNNYVQVINKDNDGNIWIGTRGGVSKYNGTDFINYTTTQGLVDNNVLSIAVDSDGSLWIGTNNGVSHYNGTTFTNYQSEN